MSIWKHILLPFMLIGAVSHAHHAAPVEKENGVPHIAAYNDWSAGTSSIRVVGNHDFVLCGQKVGTFHYDYLIHAQWGGDNMEDIIIYPQKAVKKCIHFTPDSAAIQALNGDIVLPGGRGKYHISTEIWEAAITKGASAYSDCIERMPSAFLTKLYTNDGATVNLGDSTVMMAAIDAQIMKAVMDEMAAKIKTDKNGTPNYKKYSTPAFIELRNIVIPGFLLDDKTPPGATMSRKEAYRHFAELPIHKGETVKCGLLQIFRLRHEIVQKTLISEFTKLKNSQTVQKDTKEKQPVLIYRVKGQINVLQGATKYDYSVYCSKDANGAVRCEFGDSKGNKGIEYLKNGITTHIYEDKIQPFSIPIPGTTSTYNYHVNAVINSVKKHEYNHESIVENNPYLNLSQFCMSEAEHKKIEKEIAIRMEAIAMKVEAEHLINRAIEDIKAYGKNLTPENEAKIRNLIDERMENNTAPIPDTGTTYGETYKAYKGKSYNSIEKELLKLASEIEAKFKKQVDKDLKNKSAMTYHITTIAKKGNNVCYACFLGDTWGAKCHNNWCANFGKPTNKYKQKPGDIPGRQSPIPTP